MIVKRGESTSVLHDGCPALEISRGSREVRGGPRFLFRQTWGAGGAGAGADRCRQTGADRQVQLGVRPG